MKKNFFIIPLILFSFFIISSKKEVALIRFLKDGSIVQTMYPSDTRELVIFDGDFCNFKTVEIGGLNSFKKLELLAFEVLPFLDNYNCLKDVQKSCKKLYIQCGPYFDFNIISHLTNLEDFEFEGEITEEQFNEIKQNGIDLRCFPKLKKFVFYPSGKSIKECSDIKIIHTKKIKKNQYIVEFYD